MEETYLSPVIVLGGNIVQLIMKPNIRHSTKKPAQNPLPEKLLF